MEHALLRRLNEERFARRSVILVTDLGTGEAQLVRQGEQLDELEALAPFVSEAFRSGKSHAVEVDGRHFFLNVYVPKLRLVVIGAVHISQALAPMARLAGFDVEIIDPRTAFASRDRFPDADLKAIWPAEAFEVAALDRFCALAALTHDPKIDDDALGAALNAGCFYVGALGSRKSHSKRLARLEAAGLNQVDLARIRGPIGLSIGAASPAEIAVSILAEIIAVRRHSLVSAEADLRKT